ncbi:hypothetical protein AYI69_g2003 [Smittium culicis]|uniref:Tyr recombinase domain-containing protein n=1 Tax=Smittium culicis TaxID=133412 RepID=A0A1R1YNN2_9FUNG|nr:hypothetical protein AYI69_g2003 [Smittium culicis]
MFGFLRPCDLERIDYGKTKITSSYVRFVILSPKERRSGSSIEKVCRINSHSIQHLCSVLAYKYYKSRIASEPCWGPHPINEELKINYLIRNFKDTYKKITAQRIGKHINSLIDLIPLSAHEKIPKSRALGSTIASKSGASYEDVISLGFWSSKGIFDTYYQLSRAPLNKTTNLVLSENSGAT